MSRVFGYARVSTENQDIENQRLAISNAGFEIEANRFISETVSGSTQSMKRKEFKLLVEHKLEAGDTLVVLKLDRLGRDNIDVQQTIEMLISKEIKVICLDLPVRDLSSSEGKLMLQLFSSFAEFERSRIRERTLEGLNKAKAQGKKLGRPSGSKMTKFILDKKSDGLSQSKTASILGIGLATVKRHWNK
jgi:DNA invertase Pin-like site-specific DNA recombinase